MAVGVRGVRKQQDRTKDKIMVKDTNFCFFGDSFFLALLFQTSVVHVFFSELSLVESVQECSENALKSAQKDR